jgi:hypothetical protein
MIGPQRRSDCSFPHIFDGSGIACFFRLGDVSGSPWSEFNYVEHPAEQALIQIDATHTLRSSAPNARVARHEGLALDLTHGAAQIGLLLLVSLRPLRDVERWQDRQDYCFLRANTNNFNFNIARYAERNFT